MAGGAGGGAVFSSGSFDQKRVRWAFMCRGSRGVAARRLRLLGWARRRPLACYVTLAYGLTRIVWIPAIAVGGLPGSVALSVGAFGRRHGAGA